MSIKKLQKRLNNRYLLLILIFVVLFSTTGCDALKGTAFDTYYVKILSFFGYVDKSSHEDVAKSFIKAVDERDEEKTKKLLTKDYKETFKLNKLVGFMNRFQVEDKKLSEKLTVLENGDEQDGIRFLTLLHDSAVPLKFTFSKTPKNEWEIMWFEIGIAEPE